MSNTFIFILCNLIPLILRNLYVKSNKVFQPKSVLVSLDADSEISFNHDAIVHCIAANFLQKYLESIGYKFISTILVNHCTNQMLKALYEDLKFSDNINNNSETRNIINLSFKTNFRR